MVTSVFSFYSSSAFRASSPRWREPPRTVRYSKTFVVSSSLTAPAKRAFSEKRRLFFYIWIVHAGASKHCAPARAAHARYALQERNEGIMLKAL